MAVLRGARVEVLERSFRVALFVTAIMLLIAYRSRADHAPGARGADPASCSCSPCRFWSLHRAHLRLGGHPQPHGFVTRCCSAWPIERPLDWLLFSDFAVYLGLVYAYMPFMIFPIWLSLSGIDQRLLEASWVLGAPPLATSGG